MQYLFHLAFSLTIVIFFKSSTPGPGQYQKIQSMDKQLEKTSDSKKGSGGFASKVSRSIDILLSINNRCRSIFFRADETVSCVVHQVRQRQPLTIFRVDLVTISMILIEQSIPVCFKSRLPNEQSRPNRHYLHRISIM